jgi:lincosamide and streptogramin A transport system ATP-binding/permease protein
MSLIDVSHLTFAHEGGYENIFEDVSFQLDTDWKLGFIGRNGRGKTTFLNLLLGRFEYRGGISADVEFDGFPFEVPDGTRDTIDVLRSLRAGAEDWEFTRELASLELSEDALHRAFETLSDGERTKVLLAALFCGKDRFLLIDEPTNHLDMRAREIVGRYLRSKKGFILVSHDRTLLDACVDHVLSINRANIEVQRGNFTSWQENKKRRDDFERAENERLKKDIGRLEAGARRASAWSDQVESAKTGVKNSGLKPDRGYVGHMAAKAMRRSKNLERRQETLIDEKSRLLKNIDHAGNLKILPLAYHTNRLVAVEDLSLYYGEKPVCKNVTFTIERGDRVALCGRNGSGKSSVIKRILGEEIACTGSFHAGSGLIVSYVPQDASFLRGDLSVFSRNHGIDESLFKAILRRLDFSRTQFEKDMADYSDGQKKKALIAKSLCERAHLYVWDEPLNFIDVLSRVQIEELLLRFTPTLLFVEHDAAFCENMATKSVLF